FFGLHRNDELIGAVEVYDEEERQCDIYGLVVHPKHFRKGYGTRLLTHVVQRFHLKPIFSRAVYKNPRTTPLYQKFGFYDGGREFYLNGMQLIVWRLDPRI
ncbi:MAG: GNAT family N-acetyltransferase, partial [Gammaproteobacteria bacterium]